jgi:apolipoprotein N-acyltransferase
MTISSFHRRLRPLFDRSGILSLFSGILIALSFPDAGLSFLAWIALIPLLIALEGASLSTAFRIGFTCGASAYAIILYWINIVAVQYGHLPWVLSIAVYLMLVAWLAMFFGLAAITARAGESIGIKTAFVLPLAWVSFDFIRSFLFSGFPWAMLGHSQYRILPLIQIADITGVYGVTALIVLANVVLYRILRGISGTSVPYPLKSAMFLVISLVATLLYGFNTLNRHVETAGTPIRVALIQGNIPQDVKWSPAFREKTLSIYERLTREAGRGGVDLIVWPESAVPFFFQDTSPYSERIKGLSRELNSWMLIGSPAYRLQQGKKSYLNSAFVINPSGETVARGDKLHLVPFGEYVPLKKILPFVNKLVVGIGDFSPGVSATPLDVGSTRAGLLVCYEGIFPELAREYVRNGARILVNITNDAWYGRSSAPSQHFSIAVFRAVETRTPLLRAANTGITAIIDKNGHIRSMTGLFTESFRIGEIRPGSGDSWYLLIGDLPAWLCVVLSGGIVATAWLRRFRSKRADNDAPGAQL